MASESPKPDAYISVEELAALFDGLTPRRVQQLAKEGIIPKAERGKYHVASCVPAYVRYLKEEIERVRRPDVTPDMLELRDIERRTKRANMAVSEADAALRLRQLTTVAAFERVVTEYGSRVRAVHNAAPSRYARKLFPDLPFADVLQRLKKLFDGVERDLQRDEDAPDEAAA